MPYINFKEENYKLSKQIQKRKTNNINIRRRIVENHNLINDYADFEKYSFKQNKKQFIGCDKILKEENFRLIVGKNFICADFYNCRFENVRFLEELYLGL